MLIAWADSIMLGYFMDTSTVGIYNVADPISKLILMFPTAFAALYLPLIAQVHKDKTEFKKIYYTTTKWVVIINSMALLWIILFREEIITLFFTETYIATSTPLIILIIGYFINGCIYTSRDILLLQDKTKLILKATIIAGISNVILNIILIPFYGMIGAALATATSLTILSLFLFYHSVKGTRINPFRKKTIIILILTIIAGILTKYLITSLNLNTILTIITSLILLTLISLAFITSTRMLEKEDRDMIRTIIRKIKQTLTWKE